MDLLAGLVSVLWILELLHGTGAAAHELRNSGFSSVTRHKLLQCPNLNPLVKLTLDTAGPLANVQTVVATVSGILRPSEDHWIGVFTQASRNYSDCPLNKALYLQTGDTADLPLLCDYPLKFKFVKEDPGYLTCSNKSCTDQRCAVQTCSGSVAFRLVNIRTSVTFVFFGGGLLVPCILKISQPLPFATHAAPLYGHISSMDSSATAMKLTWISNDPGPQFVEYGGDSRRVQAKAQTFTRDDMCGGIPAPAKDFGWHDPGFIHVAAMDKLVPASTYSYKYGSDKAGWSVSKKLTTPPAGGSQSVKFAIFGDMGKAERDNSMEHYIQPGSLQVIDALNKESADAVFHIGDISYATGFLAEWDFFLEMIEPVASRLPYMTAIGNHERGFPGSGLKYPTPDSGGECGVPYGTYFQMPVQELDKPWYSVEMGPVHFTVMSTEHDWTRKSEQFDWLSKDLASVNRSRTPWLVFAGHRPMYSSQVDNLVNRILPGVDPDFPPAVEPLLKENKVDLALWGHVHNYERTCAVYQKTCVGQPKKDASGVDTFVSGVSGASAPVHVVAGMAGFSLDSFPNNVSQWSSVRISTFGYTRVTANKEQLLFEFIATNNTGSSSDQFKIVRK